MSTIVDVAGWEILDSRGRPTVKARCVLASGAMGVVSVPSGASTGNAEAVELRDGDPLRYCGLGCRKAVAHVSGPIREALCGQVIVDQADLDRKLMSLDGTANKSRLGANAILAVSLAYARAVAKERGRPLYQHFADLIGDLPRTLPRPTINLFSGGKHAGGQVPIQDVLIVPHSTTIHESLAVAFAVYQAAAELGHDKYGMRSLTADEGGLAPPFATVDEMLADAVAAIRAADYVPGRDISLAIDVAASHFFQKNHYQIDGSLLDSDGMIDVLMDWHDRYPIVSVEDGLSEDDWDHWPSLCESLGSRALVLGDDLLCTNTERIRRAIESHSANALLLKVNQIGTLSEAAEALQLARSAGWQVAVSARSGETEDNWLADLAVGWSGDQIKVGSITQSERLSKYNRLLEIEAETGMPVRTWPTS